MFVSRRRSATPHLEWRIRIFGVGAILGVAGIVADAPWMIWIALAVLLMGVVLRFFPAGKGGDGPSDQDDGPS